MTTAGRKRENLFEFWSRVAEKLAGPLKVGASNRGRQGGPFARVERLEFAARKRQRRTQQGDGLAGGRQVVRYDLHYNDSPPNRHSATNRPRQAGRQDRTRPHGAGAHTR